MLMWSSAEWVKGTCSMTHLPAISLKFLQQIPALYITTASLEYSDVVRTQILFLFSLFAKDIFQMLLEVNVKYFNYTLQKC